MNDPNSFGLGDMLGFFADRGATVMVDGGSGLSMVKPSFKAQIAERLGYRVDDDEFVMALEGACVIEPEYESDPEDCISRVRGALEEMTNFDI